MRLSSLWIRFLSVLVPSDDRRDWTEEWQAELAAIGGSMTHAWGALADAWYLRTDGWTMDGMIRDVRTAFRGLVRSPFFTAIAGLTLAIGIGANTAIFSVVDAVLLNPLPYPESDRLVSYNFEAPGLAVQAPVIPLSEGLYLHYLENARSLDAFAVFNNGSVNLVTDGDPQQFASISVTSQYFDVLGIPPLLGRGLVEGEDRPGAEPVVVLGAAVWEQSFGSDPGILGRLVEMDGVQRRVVGVMPADVRALTEEVWLPLEIDTEGPVTGSLGLIGLGRLAEGITIEAADTEMQDLLMRFVEANSDALPPELIEQAGLASDVKALKELIVRDIRQILWVLLGTVGIVLLIACANVANLFLVRAEGRQRERALRAAMGASRLDIVRQYLTESIALAAGAGLVGLGLASLGVRGLMSLAGDGLPQVFEVGIDGSVLVFTLVISIGSGVLFGLFPAMGRGTRDLAHSLKDGGRSATGGRERFRVRSGLVVAQIALSLVLLVGSGLMLRSFAALRDVDPGFEAEGLLTFAYSLPEAEYADAAMVIDFHRRLSERLRALPGAERAGTITGMPLTGLNAASAMEPADQPFGEGELGPIIERRQVTPGFFAAMKIPIVDGRPLAWGDQGTEYRGVVISETLASAFWPGRSAVGQMIQSQGDTENPWEVVGVAGDVLFDAVQDEAQPVLYLPLMAGTAESPGVAYSGDVVVRVGADPLAAVQGARDALRAVDPRLPMINPRTVESVVEESMVSTSFTVILLGIAAGVALLLGTVGIYGVVAYIVSRRTQEIGVRMALGAPAATVLKGVIGQGLRLTAFGVVIGLLGAWGVSRALASLLYGVTATDPVTFIGTAGFLASVSLLATWIPARRASRVDPVQALRAE
jgi:predicted permease